MSCLVVVLITLDTQCLLPHKTSDRFSLFSLNRSPFWSTEGPYLSLSVQLLSRRETLQMQNGMSDWLLFYLAGFSSVELWVCVCVCLWACTTHPRHVEVCVRDKWEIFFWFVLNMWKNMTDADSVLTSHCQMVFKLKHLVTVRGKQNTGYSLHIKV